jgi:hypothetical protein
VITLGELVGKPLLSVSRDEANLGCHRFTHDHHSILVLMHHGIITVPLDGITQTE